MCLLAVPAPAPAENIRFCLPCAMSASAVCAKGVVGVLQIRHGKGQKRKRFDPKRFVLHPCGCLIGIGKSEVCKGIAKLHPHRRRAADQANRTAHAVFPQFQQHMRQQRRTATGSSASGSSQTCATKIGGCDRKNHVHVIPHGEYGRMGVLMRPLCKRGEPHAAAKCSPVGGNRHQAMQRSKASRPPAAWW